MVNDTVADLLARLQNGIKAKKAQVAVPVTKMTTAVLEILKQNELISDFIQEDSGYMVNLMYREDGPEITKLERKSSPGQRIYIRSKEITPVMNGRGISIISTSEGLMTGAQAKSKGLGGELICEVW